MPIGRSGGFASSTRASSTALAGPTQGASLCHQREYQEFAPLKECQYAREWCHHCWPKPAETTTWTVDKKHFKPTNILPPKAQKPRGGCPNHSCFYRLYDSLRGLIGWGDREVTRNV